MEKRFVYADNAATTPVTPAVLEAMTPWLMENYGNPSSIYSIGRAARTAVEKARRQVAAALNAEPGEIYFTSCGTEADNWALKGSMRRWAAKGKKHLITAAFEHHAILHSAKALEKEGFEITYLPVTPEGLVDPAELEKAIREDTALVSIMLANNEIGTVQPIAELAAIAHAHGAWFHTDAVQAVGHIPVDVKALGVDMLSPPAISSTHPRVSAPCMSKRASCLISLWMAAHRKRAAAPAPKTLPPSWGWAKPSLWRPPAWKKTWPASPPCGIA